MTDIHPSTPRRIRGVDAARGLALCGMIITHTVNVPGSIGGLFDGFPSASFALLAGVSLAIMASSANFDRRSIIIRGFIMILLNALLVPLAGSISVVLATFGLSFLLLFGLPKAPNYVVWLAFAWAAGISVLLSAYDFLQLSSALSLPALPGVLFGPFPLATWVTYMIVGILAWRLVVPHPRRQVVVLVVGVMLAAVAIVARPLVDVATSSSTSIARLLFIAFFDPTDHSGSLTDLIATTGGALALLSGCLLLDRWLIYPLCALGSMSLSAYILHVLSMGLIFGSRLVNSWPVALISIAALMLLACLWKHFFNQGPAERATKTIIAHILNVLPTRTTQTKKVESHNENLPEFKEIPAPRARDRHVLEHAAASQPTCSELRK